MISQTFFFFFQFFKILIFWVVMGVKGQKTVQNDKKNSDCHPSCLRNHTSYNCHLWYTCYQIFSKFWFFRLLKGKKVKKLSKMTKKVSPPCFMSHEPYIIWLSFMVHLCKMVISPGYFFSSSEFWFFGLLGGQKGKKRSNMTKNYVHHAPYLRNHTSYDCHLWYTCVKW